MRYKNLLNRPMIVLQMKNISAFPKFILAGLLLVFIFGSCAEKEVSEIEPIRVDTIEIKQENVQPILTLSGELKAASRHELSFLVAGKISEVFKKEGESVQKGTVIAKIDAIDYDQAVAIAQAKLDEANDQYARLSNMYASGSLPEADFNKIKTLKKEAEANYQLYQNKLGYTELKSDVSGVVSRIWARKGMAVDQGQPVVTILNTAEIVAQVGVPEKAINAISLGEIAQVVIQATGDTLRGKVSQINPAASRLTRTFDVEISLEEGNPSMKDGMLCTVLLEEEISTNEILIPAGLIQTDVDGINYVFVARNGVAKRQRVILGKILGNSILIEKGLGTGDDLILNPPIDLYDGSPITF